MHRATPSSSSASPSSSHRSKKRPQLSRQQLLKSLDILGPVSALLPPELPPSPPASRESSPAPTLKRRLNPDSEQSQNKRPRTSSASPSSRLSPPSHPVPVPSSSRHEPAEDGEVKEDPPAPPQSFAPVQLPPNFPVRRPRRGNNMPASEWEAIYDKCFANARMLKYSAYARVAAAHPTTSKDYKALRDPPAPNSSYATHSLLMARLELVDSLLHFIYGLWCREYGVRTCYRASWRTVDDALSKTESKWQSESRDDREKAFIGLIQMVHAFIHGRKLRYHMTLVDQENDKKLQRVKLQWEMEQKKKSQAAAQHTPSNVTPKMLPSPASSSTTSSSNSTPLGGHGTPSHNTPSPPTEAPPRAVPPTLPPATVNIGVNAQFIWENKSQSSGLRVALDRIDRSQATLNLPVLLKHFPRTFARMINSTLTPSDEHEPDFQDNECELYWPGQVITGEGLGWVCLMGMSMVKEFGRDLGYTGIDGIVHRQAGDENLGYAEPRFSPHSR